MDRPTLQPDKFDIDSFLRDHWQRAPLLIRNPWASWINPLDPDELAGLACEDDIEARLIRQDQLTAKAEHGPFSARRFGKLDKQPWTLLVQAVDHHVPAVAALLDPFRFVPNWRIDDVMVSYATDGGGVGAHFDQYDVFLVQGLGRRRWRVGGACDADTPLLPHDDLRLLADFRPTDEWVLEPGDMLYVPPRIAHEGVAIGDDCMTYSIGFRAPSRAELIGGWCDHLLGRADDGDRFRDPPLDARANPGEITAPAIARLQAMVAEAMLDRDAFTRWFGEHNSTRKYPDIDWSPDVPMTAAALRARLANGVALWRNGASRFSFVRQGEDALLLFVDGRSFACAGGAMGLAERLCADDRIMVDRGVGAEDVVALLVELINQGSLALAED